MSWFRRVRLGARFVIVLLVAACGEDEAGPTGETGSFQLTVSPAVLTLAQGASGSVTVSMTPVGGFGGRVTVVASGLPTGVTATITPPELSVTAAGATVAVAVGATVTPGTYPVTLTGTAAGLPPATATYQLTVTPAPDYALTVSPTTLSIAAGSSVTATVNVQRTNLTAGVSLTMLPPPAGITGAFTPTVATANTSELVVTVAASVAPGSYSLTIQGSATGLIRTTTLSVTVAAPPASYSIGLSPATLSVPAGGSGVVNLTLTRTSFSGLVTLAFENPPPGITGTLAPPSTSGNASVFTIQVGAGTQPGTYQLGLRGTAAGLNDRVASVQLTVTAPAPGIAVQYSFCDPSVVPVFFAYQDGAGTWQALSGSTSGGVTRFAFNLAQGRGGVLVVHPRAGPAAAAPSAGVGDRLKAAARRARWGRLAPGARGSGSWASALAMADVHWTEVRFGSTAELVQDGSGSCGRSRPTKTVSARVRGIGPGEFGVLSLGGDSDNFIDGDEYSDPLVIEHVPGGVFDVVGARMRGLGDAPDRTVVMRGLDVPDGGTLATPIDFQGPASAAAATATATLTGLAGDHAEIYVDLITANSWSLLWYDGSPDGGNVRPWGGLASASMAIGDVHGLYGFAGPAESNGYDYRLTLNFVGPVSNQTLPLGPWVAATAASLVSGGGYPRFRFQGALPSVYEKGVAIDVGSEGEGIVYSLLATSAYLAASGSALSYDLTMPDVGSLAGFPAAARLPSGNRLVLTTAMGFSGAGALEHKPTVGSQFRASLRASSIQVP